MEIYNKQVAKTHIMTKGVKVAVQVGFEGKYVFVEKSDFVREIIDDCDDGQFTDYDGNPCPVRLIDGVVHIPCGIK